VAAKQTAPNTIPLSSGRRRSRIDNESWPRGKR
jgi:hypothetical protein